MIDGAEKRTRKGRDERTKKTTGHLLGNFQMSGSLLAFFYFSLVSSLFRLHRSLSQMKFQSNFSLVNKVMGRRTIRDFATRRFRTQPGSLTSFNGRTSVAIISSPWIRLHQHRTPRFSGDIIDRSVIYPMEEPFCFRSNPNNNVLPKLLLHVHE